MMRVNFGKNVQLSPRTTYTPTSERDVLEILDRHRGNRIRVIGRLHSWSKAVETDDVLLDLRHLNQVETTTDGGTQSARVGAGCQIKQLLSELQRQKNWTLPSVGFSTEQTIAGAISTGTHGSGKHSLSHYVKSVRVAKYDPKNGKAVIEEVSEGPVLLALRCSLGSIGVIVSVQMQCRQAFAIEESFHEFAKLSDVVNAEEAYPLQQFYLVPWRWTYFAQHRREVSRPCSRLLLLYTWYRFLFLDIGLHLALLFAVRILKWNSAIRATIGWIVPKLPNPLASETWYSITLSNFDARKNQQAFESVCAFLTHNMLRLFAARPHWGKLCSLTPRELKDLYPRFNEFRQICWEYDSSHAFRNRWTDELLCRDEESVVS